MFESDRRYKAILARSWNASLDQNKTGKDNKVRGKTAEEIREGQDWTAQIRGQVVVVGN